MHPLTRRSARTLAFLTRDLVVPWEGAPSHRRYDNAPGSFVPLSVERLGENLYSIAHYIKQNGDMIADPDIELWKPARGIWYPVGCQQGPSYSRAVEFGADGQPSKIHPGVYRSIRELAQLLLRNVVEQQGLREQLRQVRREGGTQPWLV